MDQIYLDHAATTPLDPRVLEAMRPFLVDSYGNASSVHTPGRKARFAVEASREEVAELLGVEPGEILFTSGGTEANNTAMKGTRGAIVTGAAEHESILRAAEAEERTGRTVIVLSPDRTGAVSADQVQDALDGLGERAGLVSIMHANNEIGTLSPVAEIATRCRARGVLIHCDAVQTTGYGMSRPEDLGVDLMTISAHKFYGPKGAGALYVRSDVEITALLHGGAQERGRRGGTENVAAIVGLARALRLAFEERRARWNHATALRDRLIDGIRQALSGRAWINTPVTEREVAPHIVNVAFPPIDGEPVDGEMLLANLDLEGVYASAGSACTSGALEPSHVLTAIGLPAATARAAVRLSVGKDTSEADVDRAIDALVRVIRRMQRSTAVP